jgi:hypothetical protein
MMDELIVIIGAELILLVSIAAMSLRGRRMDVLSGHYFGNETDWAVSLGWNIDRLRRWVEREREVHRLKKARARTSNAGRLRPSAALSRDRAMETISRNRRRSRSTIIPGSQEVDDHAVHPGQARVGARVTGWG